MKKALAIIAGLAAMSAAFEGNEYDGEASRPASRPPNDKIKPVLFTAKKKPGKFKPKQFKKRKGRSE